MRKHYKTNAKERTAGRTFLEGLEIVSRKTKEPHVIALIGLVGSGKSGVAKEIARHIGGVVIETDLIRNKLRKRNLSYKSAYLLAENIAAEMLKKTAMRCSILTSSMYKSAQACGQKCVVLGPDSNLFVPTAALMSRWEGQ